MDGFVSYEENFEEDSMFNRQPVEVDKKKKNEKVRGEIIDKSGSIVLNSLELSWFPLILPK